MNPNFSASKETGIYDPKENPDGWRVYDEPLAAALSIIVIHHSALPLSDTVSKIQRKHILERGFADIAYHFVVDETGQVFEGRSINVRGAHVAGHNTGAVGIVLLGDFEKSSPSEAQLTNTKALLRYLVTNLKIKKLTGHRDFNSANTVCPGRNLEILLPQIASECGLEYIVHHGPDGHLTK